jgi:hypothetical protein
MADPRQTIISALQQDPEQPGRQGGRWPNFHQPGHRSCAATSVRGAT